MKERVIVYALGEYWKKNANDILKLYDVIACCDQNPNAAEYAMGCKFISPEQIAELPYDRIMLGCKAQGVRENIVLKYNIPVEKILYFNEVLHMDKQLLANWVEKKFSYNEMLNICNREVKEEGYEHTTKLTIAIPTYNRKSRLNRTLDILEIQSDKDFKIVILDNGSNYDIQEILMSRDEEFIKKITVVHNKRNIGMSVNLANAFIHEMEGWLWILADDDIPSIHAVEDIYKEIEHLDNVGAVIFSIDDLSGVIPEGYRDFINLKELIKYFQYISASKINLKYGQGDFIYLSNKIYNMKYINRYCEQIFNYTYSGIPQLVPILFMLDDSTAVLRISNKKIVSYDSPDGDHWNIIKTALGMRVITDFPLSLTEEEKSVLYRWIMVNYRSVLAGVDMQNMYYDIMQVEKMYYEIYRHYFTDEENIDYKARIEELKTIMNRNSGSID